MYVDEYGWSRWDNDMYVETIDGRKVPSKCPNCKCDMIIERKVGFTAICENGHFYGVIENPIRSNKAVRDLDILLLPNECTEDMLKSALKGNIQIDAG